MRKDACTDKKVIRAVERALTTIANDDAMGSCSVSCGFSLMTGKKDEYKRGYQVFVKVCRFDEELLEDYPDSGGLVDEASRMKDLEDAPDHCDDAGTCKCSYGRRNDGN